MTAEGIAAALVTPSSSTLFLIAAIILGLIAGLQFILSKRLHTAALRFWASSNLVFCLGCTLFAMRDVLPLSAPSVAGSGLLILGIGLIAGGIAAFDGRRPRFGLLFAGPVVAVAMLAVSVAGGDQPAERILISSLGVTFYTLLAVTLLLRLKVHRLDGVQVLCAGVMFLFAAVYLARGGGVYFGVIDPTDPFGGGWARVLALTMAVTWSFCSLFLPLDRAASVDGLTGLFNHKATLSVGQDRLKEALSRNHPLSVLLLDLDHFKRVNDRFGHHVGDQALKAFATVMLRSVRTCDVVGRLGGEEFCIILPLCTEAKAFEIAERLRRRCETELEFVARHRISLTVTIGVVTRSPTWDTISSLMKAADAALYEGKALGRNRVIYAGATRSTGEMVPEL
ncbi:Uncharacterised protein [Starkeya nomas]|uniref:diguanylate cyclase n=1 Tax=Starkeya nomas TaxID=2666134 RepID=A0A5S9NJR0_9HYPH|nr:GGDEF domain-containing protein [Starkeya nomas]CAA0090865.1 Uncharacterised protein [Starkeya nomas]